MTEDKTKQLIKQLSKQKKKQKKLYHPMVRTLFIIAVCIVYMGVIAFTVLNPRDDLVEKLTSIHFTLEQILAFSLGVLGAFGGFFLSIPGKKHKNVFKWVAGALIIILLAAFIFNPTHTFTSTLNLHEQISGLHCMVTLSVLSLPPLIFALYLIKKAAPTSPALSGALAFIGISSIGYIFSRFTCPMEDTVHHITSHWLPLLLATIAGYFFGKSYLKW